MVRYFADALSMECDYNGDFEHPIFPSSIEFAFKGETVYIDTQAEQMCIFNEDPAVEGDLWLADDIYRAVIDETCRMMYESFKEWQAIEDTQRRDLPSV